MGAMASQITNLTIVYSTVLSGGDQRKHQSSASLAFAWGIHRWPVNFSHKWPATRKMFQLDDVNIIADVVDFSQSPCTTLTILRKIISLSLGLCQGTVSGFWKTQQISTDHLDPEIIASEAIPKLYLDQPITKRAVSANWKPCVIHRWQSYNHQAGTV